MVKKIKQPKYEQGQSLVELALSLTLLLLLLGGAIDLGRMFFTYIALRDAAREGAIYGSYCPNDVSGITSRVQNSATGPVDSTGFTVDGIILDTSPPVPGSGITVRVTFNFEVSMPFLGAAIGKQSFPMSAVVSNTILSINDPSCP
jgi:Flp pilus assembly protein TadG